MKIQDRELLEALKEAFAEFDTPFEIIDVDGKDVLTRFFDRSSELAPEDLSIDIVHLDELGDAIRIMVSVFYGLDARAEETILGLLPALNSLLDIGCFCMIPEGYLYLSYAFMTDDLDENNAAISLAADTELLTATAVRARELLLPIVRGEIDPDGIDHDAYRIAQI